MAVVDAAPARGQLQGEDCRDLAPERGPRVSVVVPAYLSHETVAGCLEAFRRQEYRSFEVVVVDSSPDDRTARVVRGFPEVRLVRSRRRLLPHAARNLGVRRSRGELLVFMDPDVYPRSDCLGELVAAYGATGRPVVGALSCHGRRWLDVGIHLCKFSKWLPGGTARPVDMSPTANMLVDRATFQAAGGFEGGLMLGDALFSWRLREAGWTLGFAPRAEVAHHHTSGLRAFLRERYVRGVMFGVLRADWEGLGRGRSLLYLAVSLLPVRLARILALTAGHCRRAGQLRQLLATLPVPLLGHAASLLGESRAYLARVVRPRPGASRRGGRIAARAAPLTRT
ncbi:MAG TPA: glycosyltransferase [Thermoanaerobaculia bacterium]